MTAEEVRARARWLGAAVARVWWPDGPTGANGPSGANGGEGCAGVLPDQSRRTLGVAHRLAVRTLRRDWESVSYRTIGLSAEECAVVVTRLHCIGLGLLQWSARPVHDRVAVAAAAMLLGDDLTLLLLRACGARARRPAAIREGASLLLDVFQTSSDAVRGDRSPLVYLPERLAQVYDDALAGAVAASVCWYAGVLRLTDPGPDAAIAEHEESLLLRFLHPGALRLRS